MTLDEKALGGILTAVAAAGAVAWRVLTWASRRSRDGHGRDGGGRTLRVELSEADRAMLRELLASQQRVEKALEKACGSIDALGEKIEELWRDVLRSRIVGHGD